MLDYQYTRTEGLTEAIKSKNDGKLSAALLEEESSFSMHVFRYTDGKIVMDEGKAFSEEEFLEEYECRYWILR